MRALFSRCGVIGVHMALEEGLGEMVREEYSHDAVLHLQRATLATHCNLMRKLSALCSGVHAHIVAVVRHALIDLFSFIHSSINQPPATLIGVTATGARLHGSWRHTRHHVWPGHMAGPQGRVQGGPHRAADATLERHNTTPRAVCHVVTWMSATELFAALMTLRTSSSIASSCRVPTTTAAVGHSYMHCISSRPHHTEVLVGPRMLKRSPNLAKVA